MKKAAGFLKKMKDDMAGFVTVKQQLI